MVDNFNQIKRLLKFDSEGDCYYIQLLRRQADDPKINGVSDPKYHGNMHSRSIKDYFVKSIDHLDDIEQDIKKLCEIFNVRAYIRLNKRNYKQIDLNILKHIAEQCASGETYSSPFHLVASAAGKANCAGKDKTWIVDLDKEYLPYEEEIKKIIVQCEPYDKLVAESSAEQVMNSMPVIPTKSGKHIISRPFNKDRFNRLWRESPMKELNVLDIHPDNPTILYVP